MTAMNTIMRRRAAFSNLLKDLGENPNSLAKKSGVPRSTIVSFLRGQTDSFKGTTESKIAAALRVSVEELYGEMKSAPAASLSVTLTGSIGRGLAVAIYAAVVAQPNEAHEIVIPAVEAAPGYLYYRIATEGAPLGPPGWVIRVLPNPQPPAELVGMTVLAELSDGTRWLGQLRQWGDRPGRYSLYRWNVGEPIDNVVITTVHRVVGSFDPQI